MPKTLNFCQKSANETQNNPEILRKLRHSESAGASAPPPSIPIFLEEFEFSFNYDMSFTEDATPCSIVELSSFYTNYRKPYLRSQVKCINSVMEIQKQVF